MTSFTSGPAKGSTLLLLRGPDYLRLAEDTRRTDAARFAALEALADEPGDYEHHRLWAYRRLTPRERYTIYKDRAKYVVGQYELVEPQPGQDVMRDNASWRAWVLERKAEDAAQGQSDRGIE